MTEHDRPVAINISGIPVAGIGGLGLVAMAVLVSVVMPEARWTMAAGIAGGVMLAVALVLARRYFVTRGPSGDDPRILFRAVPLERDLPECGSHTADASHRATGADRELLATNC